MNSSEVFALRLQSFLSKRQMPIAPSLVAACRHAVILAQQQCRCSRCPAALPSKDLGLASSHEGKKRIVELSIISIRSSESAPLSVKAKQQVPMQMHATTQCPTYLIGGGALLSNLCSFNFLVPPSPALPFCRLLEAVF